MDSGLGGLDDLEHVDHPDHRSVADRALALAPWCRDAAGAYALAPSRESWERLQQRRRDAVAELVHHAGGRRAPVAAAYDALVDRIARRSDDFDAAEALRLVVDALATIGWADQTGQAGAWSSTKRTRASGSRWASRGPVTTRRVTPRSA